MNALTKIYDINQKIQKPDFDTKTGREFLAFYLQTKFKQILNYDRKNGSRLFLKIREGFLQDFLDRLVHLPDKRIMIGITGESASGKSTICTRIQNIIDKTSMPISIISGDNYFVDISDLIKKYGSFDNLRDNGYDIDAPCNFRLELLKNHALALQAGQDVRIPKYLTNGTGISVLNATSVSSKKIIVIEGMPAMYEPVRGVFDIKIYVETSKKVRRKRFLERAENRNQDRENALKHWAYVENAGKKYIQPAKDACDIIINGECNLEYFSEIIEFINHTTNCFEVNRD